MHRKSLPLSSVPQLSLAFPRYRDKSRRVEFIRRFFRRWIIFAEFSILILYTSFVSFGMYCDSIADQKETMESYVFLRPL